VIGVDNDELMCDLCDPPLTSIILDTDGTGYKAAELLDQMMSRRDVPGKAHLFKPLGIVPRTSTDSLAMADPEVVRAVQFIRRHACDGIAVADLLENVPLSRRVLEHRFAEQVGKSPHQQIVQTRLERVKDMLINTDLPLTTIASRCGFKHQEYMSVVFKKHVGLPPSEYRDTHQVS
jgi:LacI family transcriptional regulator, galactose operon repressor